MESYLKSNETFASMFENQLKYNAIRDALAEIMYRDFRSIRT